jgi:hypothetical protein
MDTEATETKPGFTFAMFASSSQQRDFMEAFDGFEQEWESQGYESLSSSQTKGRLSGRTPYPEEWMPKGPINAAFGPPHFIQFIAFLKDPFTVATIEVILAGILHSALTRFRRLFGEGKGKKTIQLPVKLCPTLWFACEEVLVTIIADIETPEDFRAAELLIAEGFRRASLWIDHHGVTHPYLTYHIRNGNLDVKPTLSQRPLTDE